MSENRLEKEVKEKSFSKTLSRKEDAWLRSIRKKIPKVIIKKPAATIIKQTVDIKETPET